MDKADRAPLMAGQDPPDAAPIGRVLKNVASNYAGKGIELVTFLLLTPFLLHVLGPVQFGLWSLTGSLVAYGGLLDFGVSNAVTKQVAEYMALDRLTEVRRMLATSLWLYCAVGLLILVLSVTLAMLLPLFVALPPGTRREAPWLVIALGATLAVSFPGTSAFAALQGLHRYDVASAVRTAWTVSSALAAVAALQFSQSALAVALSNLPVAVAFQAAVFGILHRLSPELRFDPRQAERKLLRPIASFSSAVFVSNAAFRLETKTDEVVIGSLLGVASVTPYAVAQKLAGLAELLTEQFRRVLLPIASELTARERLEHLRLLYSGSTRITLAINVPLVATLAILARPILGQWVGDTYAGGGPLVGILAVAGLIAVSQRPAATMLQGMNRHHPLAIMSLASGVLNLGLSLVLVRQFGLVGVAVGTLVPTALVYLAVMLPFCLRVLDVSWGTALRQMFLPPILAVAPTVALLLEARRLWNLDSLPVLLGCALGGLIVYAAVYLGFAANDLERRTCLNVVHIALRFVRSGQGGRA